MREIRDEWTLGEVVAACEQIDARNAAIEKANQKR